MDQLPIAEINVWAWSHLQLTRERSIFIFALSLLSIYSYTSKYVDFGAMRNHTYTYSESIASIVGGTHSLMSALSFRNRCHHPPS